MKTIILVILLFLLTLSPSVAIDTNQNLSNEQQKFNSAISLENKQNISLLKNSNNINLIINVNTNEIETQDIRELSDKIELLKNKGAEVRGYKSIIDDNNINIYVETTEPINSIKEEIKSLNNKIKISENRRYEFATDKNDTYYSLQWNLDAINYEKIGQISGSADEVIVAVIDSGINVNDPDFTSNLWTNDAELNGMAGVDDDENGYIDDIHGCNFLLHNNYPEIEDPCNKAHLNDVEWGSSSHGSYVSSMISPVSDNNWGLAGVCSNCKLMILDVTDSDGANLSEIMNAMDYAVDNGAELVNISLVSSCPFDSSEDILSEIIRHASADGMQIVQAAGNSGELTVSDCLSHCGYSNSYCYSSAKNETYYYIDGKDISTKVNVASSAKTDLRSMFSNYDDRYDATTIAAPGEEVPVFNGSLNIISGTSFSAPLVTGSIGELIGRVKYQNRTISPIEVKDMLKSTSKKNAFNLDIGGVLDLYNFIYFTLAKLESERNDLKFVSRFWSERNQSHFFTASIHEASSVMLNYVSDVWKYEGTGFKAFYNAGIGKAPVYRFWSDKLQGHFYTKSSTEKDMIIADYPDEVWRYEGIAFYTYTSRIGDSIPIYRFWSDKNQHHFYTSNESEKNYIIENYPENIWKYEGIGWYAPR